MSEWKKAIAGYGRAVHRSLEFQLEEEEDGVMLYQDGEAVTLVPVSDETIDAICESSQTPERDDVPDLSSGWVPYSGSIVKAEEPRKRGRR